MPKKEEVLHHDLLLLKICADSTRIFRLHTGQLVAVKLEQDFLLFLGLYHMSTRLTYATSRRM